MAHQSGLNSLATIIKRLEAATSRLEDVALAAQQSSAPGAVTRSTEQVHDQLVSQLPTSPGGPSGIAAAASSSKEPASIAPAVRAYQEMIIDGPLQEYLQKSQDAGGIIGEQAALVSKLCSAQRDFIQKAGSCAKPSTQQELLPHLADIQAAIGAVNDFRATEDRKKENRPFGNHFSAVCEGANAWGWIAVEPTPAPFVGDMKDSAQFYTNRVIKEFKDSDPKQVAWARSFIALIEELQKYVKQYHTTGVTWNPKGVPASQYKSQASLTDAVKSAPSPPPAPAPVASASPSATGGPGGFLAELNKGTAVTSGLKKVDPTMQTHKNPNLRASSVVADKSGPPERPAKPSKLASQVQVQKKPAKTELDGTKWNVEYHENTDGPIVIEDTAINQTVYIFACKNAVVQIKGKVNAISMLNCHRTSILLDSVVSQVSITSSPSFTAQILGLCPTLNVEKTDSGNVYLSKECLDTVEIVTGGVSSLNISIPTGEEGDFEEKPVPEQMKSVIRDGKLVTTIVEHSG
ncbi:hypothetical protein QFC22_000794 [Naganishia vaughanmartiniae]|uniref:Uncharacterized protein n=1 Tax=Naganishia vaughanmartiniae TaxID=1424756 RepID=A0ACC2XL57_9TREE|nr:hypothetical protein QFC22_000794 [Naganishia vaughanmartiniae]